MTKVMTIVGTRPEVIRLSRVIARLDETVDHVLVHTGQNYDYELNGIFFDELGIREPDHFMNVDTASLGTVLSGVLAKTEELINRESPDAVLVLGDTNSCIAALMARRMKVPVYHMEAGNRCFDNNVPEEINRRMVDHVADFNLVYTEHARRNLLAEGLHPSRIYLTGSPMNEVLSYHRRGIESSNVLERLNLKERGYFLVSAHREENVDLAHRLKSLLDCLSQVQERWKVPVLVSTHPRTRRRLDTIAIDSQLSEITFHEPFGFLDYNRLQMSAVCVLSDSGTVSEESAILGFPAVSLRESTERPEALDTGGMITTGIDAGTVIHSVESITRDAGGTERADIPNEYLVRDAARRVSNIILSTVHSHRDRFGIRTDR